MAKQPEAKLDDMSDPCPLDTEVKAALARIVGSPPFTPSPRLQQFLSYIVNETLKGHSDRIIGYAIGVDVYDKPETFNPTTDTVVRVEAGRLRRQLADYNRGPGADDPVEIIVPKGTYVPQFRYRAEDRVITAVVSSADDTEVEKRKSSQGPSIAVLPFENFGKDQSDQYFANGLTEEVTANLARYKGLFVFARYTSARLAKDGVDIGQIYDEIGADFVMEGSIRLTDTKARVTVQLIDAQSDGHILAEQFERPATPDGIYEIQDEIAILVAARVADQYGPLGRYIKRTYRTGQSKQWETFYWINRFYDYYASHEPKMHLEVREGLESSLKSDPTSSDGCAALAITLLDEYRLHINERSNFPVLDKALEYALSATTLDPENAFAYQALALVQFHRMDFAGFGRSAERAIELNPGHANMLADIGHSYSLMGNWDRGVPLLHRAIELSPVHPGWYHHALAWRNFLDGHPQKALDELNKTQMTGFRYHHAFAAAFLAELGNAEAAEKEVNILLSANPDFCATARQEMKTWCIDEELANAMLRSWRKAGLEIA